MEEDDQPKEADAGTWLTSYADLMTLVACFFILMVAFANFEDPVFQKRASEFGKYFRGSLIKDSGEKVNVTEEEYEEQATNLKINKTANKDERTTLDLGNSDKRDKNITDTISKAESGELNKKVYEQDFKLAVKPGISEISYPKDIEIVFGGSAVFEPGKVTLSEKVIYSLAVMIDLIREREGDYVVLVEGHTDDTDIKSRRYPSNWELSSARAAKVISVFEKSGIKRNRLVAVGYGDTRPIYQNYDEEGNPIPENQRLNRRVSIKVLARPDEDKEKMGLGIFFRGKNVPPKSKIKNNSKNK